MRQPIETGSSPELNYSCQSRKCTLCANGLIKSSDILLVSLGLELPLIGFPFFPLCEQEANLRNDYGNERANNDAVHGSACQSFTPIDLACMNCSRYSGPPALESVPDMLKPPKG